MPLAPRQLDHSQILIVEDNEDLRRVLKDVLEFEGFSILGAASGEEALGILAALPQSPNLVLTDLQLDGMDGCTLLVHLRGSERWKTVPVIFLSGHVPLADACGGLDILPDGIVEKPFEIVDLVNTIRVTIQAAQQR